MQQKCLSPYKGNEYKYLLKYNSHIRKRGIPRILTWIPIDVIPKASKYHNNGGLENAIL